MTWGGARPGAGRKPNPTSKKVSVEPRQKSFPFAISQNLVSEVIAASEKHARNRVRTPDLSPFRIARHPPNATPPASYQMAMDESLDWASSEWAGSVLGNVAAEGLLFLGYPFLAELAQRPEYRVISETIATEMTRKWITFQGSGTGDDDKADKIKELTDEFERLEVRERFKEVALYDGLMGRGHLFLDLGADVDDMSGELATPIGDGRGDVSKGKVAKGSLKRLKTVEAVWTYPTTYNATNPLKEDWYNPQVWYVMGRQIHASRLLTFIGHPVPDMLKPAYSFGGLSLSQMAKPYVDIWLKTRESVAELIHSFSVMVLMTDMQTILQPGNAGGLLARAALFNALRDNQGLMVVNKNTEDFKNVSTSLAGLHELQAQSQEHMMSIARIPAVKFTGMQPTGLNASSEGEMRAFNDTILAYEESLFRPNLTKVSHFVQLSLWGEVDPEITFKFNPLHQLTEKEEAEVRKLEAETDDILVNGCAALRPEEVRRRVAADPDTPHAGLDVEDVPEPPEPGEEGGKINIKGTEPFGKGAGQTGDAAATRTVLLVRHGATELNNDDVSVDRIRGWKDIPLSEAGEREAERLGADLADDPPDVIVTSDLKRARDTAEVISKMTGVPIVEVSKSFRPWNVGRYAGHLTSEAVPILADYAENRPGEAIPGGESFDGFRARFFGGLRAALTKNAGRVAVVTHHRDERLLRAWEKARFPEDGGINIEEFNQKGEHTGAVIEVAIPTARLRAE